MNSRAGVPGEAPGVGQEVDRGSVGTVAPATPNGSARVLIGTAAAWLMAVSFVAWLVVSRERDGLLLLTTVFAGVLFWAAGVFSRQFWR